MATSSSAVYATRRPLASGPVLRQHAPARSAPPAAPPPAPDRSARGDPPLCPLLNSRLRHRNVPFLYRCWRRCAGRRQATPRRKHLSAAAQQVLLDVPELIGQVHVVLVGVVETLHLVPQGVYLLTAVFADLRQRRAVVYPLAVAETPAPAARGPRSCRCAFSSMWPADRRWSGRRYRPRSHRGAPCSRP